MATAPCGSPARVGPGHRLPGYRNAGLLALLALLLLAFGPWPAPLGMHASPTGLSGPAHGWGVSLSPPPSVSGPSPVASFFGQSANYSSVSMAYDAHDGVSVAVAEVIGPGTSYAPSLETWTYTDPNSSAAPGNWTELYPIASPPARIGASMTYDPISDSVILFGGLGPNGYLSDTWSYSSGNWTNLTASAGPAPPARADSSFAWDGADAEAVLYDGIGAHGTNWTNPITGTTSTWVFYSQRWLSVAQPASTVPPGQGAMAYDALDGYLLYVGGSNAGAPCGSASTFSFVNGTWTNLTGQVRGAPSARIDPSATYDSFANRIVLFGGQDCVSYRSDTWTYSAGDWSQGAGGAAPSARDRAPLGFDYLHGAGVLVGGIGVNGPLADTWSYFDNATGWVHRGPVLTVPGTLPGAEGATADAGTNVTVVVQGAMDVGATSYRYTGLPASCPASPGASFVCPSASAGRYLLGGRIDSGIGSSPLPTTPLLLNVPPAVSSFNLSSTETEPQVPVTLNATVTGGTAPYQYAYSGLPPGCASFDLPQISCTPSSTGSFVVTVTVTDADAMGSSESVGLVVGPYPFLASATLTERLIDVGQSTEINLVAGGGSGPLTYTYTGLPEGCASANSTSLVCAPTVPGTYVVTVHATDPYGYTASRAVRFQIDPELVAVSLRTNASRVIFGDPMAIALVVNGGTTPIFITYNGLPSGCESENATDFACTPRVEGTFVILATIVDGLNETSAINCTVVIAAAPVVIGPSPPNGGGSAPSAGAELWLTAGIGVLALAVAITGSLGLWIARDRSRARAGHALAQRMLAEAPSLGRQFGRIDDPKRPR